MADDEEKHSAAAPDAIATLAERIAKLANTEGPQGSLSRSTEAAIF